MNILLKKTLELSIVEIEQICNVFNIVFSGHTKRAKDFNDEFCNTAFGYSYHVLLTEDGHIVGSQSYIPFYYYIGNEKYQFALSVDTMILQQYRIFDNFYDLWFLGRNFIKSEGVSFYFGFPNENSYPLSVKGFGDRDMGDLSTYILPLKISALKKDFSYLNIFSISFSQILLFLSLFNFRKSNCVYIIKKDRQTFDNTRFKWFKGEYIIVKENDFSFVYKISEYEGIKAAFLIDVNPMSKKKFDKAVRIINKQNHNVFDVVLYVGHLHFCPFSMIKIPKKYEPKKFHFTGKILDDSLLNSKIIYDVKNWEVNLSSFDLV